MKHLSKKINLKNLNLKENLEIRKIEKENDFNRWDKKRDVLFTCRGDKQNVNLFINLAKKIKRYKKEVFINYGLLTHPAIILREMGFNVLQYCKNYHLYHFDYSNSR